MNRMPRLFLFAAILILSSGLAAAQKPAIDDSPQTLFKRAEALRLEGSYRLARELYEKILASEELDPALAAPARVWKWDTLWRERGEGDWREQSLKELGRLVEDLKGHWQAEAAESLGDLQAKSTPRWWRWQLAPAPKPGEPLLAVEAWLIAADFWGKADDVAAAKPRYIALNFKIADLIIDRQGLVWPYPARPMIQRLGIVPPPPPEDQPWTGDTATLALRNVLRVTGSDTQRTRALMLLGRQRVSYQYSGPKQDAWIRDREAFAKEGEDYLRRALAIAPINEWTDDAYQYLLDYLQNKNRLVEAVELIRSYLEHYSKGESRYYDGMRQTLKTLTEPSAGLWSNETFAPASYLKININYRNLDGIKLRLTRIDPGQIATRRLSSGDREDIYEKSFPGKTILDLDVKGIINEGKHIPHNKEVYLEPVEPGVYQIEIDAPGVKGDRNLRRLIWVSGLAVASKHDGLEAHIYVADAESGQPTPDAHVQLLYGHRLRPLTGGKIRTDWKIIEGRTSADGLAHFDVPKPPSAQRYHGTQYMTLADKDGHPARLEGQSHWGRDSLSTDRGRPVIYATTDRPAYRPGEPINWKVVLRKTDGKTYRLAEESDVFVRIRDARGETLYEEYHDVNAWGSLSGSFEVGRTAALGMLNIEVRNQKESAPNNWQSSAPLCRVEEYKLPEYKVDVTPGEGQYKFGSAVPFKIQAEYYFGGPVAGADVEIVVHRQPFWPGWTPPWPYPWLEGTVRRRHGSFRPWMPHEPETIVLQKTLKSDPEGVVNVEVGALTDEEIKQARDKGFWGYRYRVEARVVDASRREVRSSGSIKVARTAFAAYLNPQRFLYLPGDTVKVDLRTLDPNDQPVAAEGFVTIFKRVWNEKKINVDGKVEPAYDDTKLFSKPAVTGESGETTVEFDPSEAGHYLLRYKTRDRFGETVTGETTVMVADQNTASIGYRSGGVEIITDKQTYKRGETAHVMLAVRRPGVAVWFAVEGERIHEQQIVRLDGTVKLLAIPVTGDLEPNIFLTAMALFDYSAFRDTQQIMIPPERQFLTVNVTTDAAEYRPGQTAKVDVEVTDAEGNPVATELDLGASDAAVWAIQGDVAGDIRGHFWSRMRSNRIGTQASPERSTVEFWKPIEGKPGEFEPFRREGIAEVKEEVLRQKSRYANGGMAGRENLFFGKRSMAKGASMDGDLMVGDGIMAEAAPMMADAAAPGAEPTAPARVRTDFRATAFWQASIVTGPDGRATAEIPLPDSLTTWNVTARAADKATRVGQVRETFKTNKPIMIRPQGPRYFIEGDEVTLSAIVNNNTGEVQTVRVELDVEGLDLIAPPTKITSKPGDESTSPVATVKPSLEIVVPAGGQRRVDWRVRAGQSGEALIRTRALTQVDSDAVERTFPIHEYGIEQFIANGFKLEGDPGTVEQTMTLTIPAERRAGSEGLTLWIEPTLARTMVNSLDYLADYPYGCVEQTLSRFLPAAITLHTIKQLALEKPDLEKKLPEMIETGLARIYDLQHADGGWSWMPEGEGDPFMTAYVVQGLAQAREAGVKIKKSVLSRGAQYLQTALVEAEDRQDLTAFMLYALSRVNDLPEARGKLTDAAHERLWPERQQLNPYTRALFALANHGSGRSERATILARNMRNGLIENPENNTAHWGRSGVYYRWSNGGVESTAFGLRALLAIEPGSELIDPAMGLLVRNRRGNRWENTRDTAFVIRALADYITVRGEDKPDWTAEVIVNGQTVAELTVTPENVFDFEGKVVVPADKLKTGENTVTIRRKGSGVLYASAWLTYFTRQGRIKEAGNEVFVTRRFYRVKQSETLSGEYRQVRDELKPGEPLASGDRIEVELSLKALNHYEYLIIEDRKAAGLEPVEVKSGWTWGDGVGAYREWRDEKTVFYIRHLLEGDHTLLYTLRAEVPGVFQALPTTIHAMYVPEIRANSTNEVLAIEDSLR